MKLRILPVTKDLRNDQQREYYNTIEQRRAEAWLQLERAQRRSWIAKGQLLNPLLRRQAD